MTRLVRTLALSLSLSLVPAADAAVAFSDDFNADTLGLNKTTFLGGWTVTDGTVDLVNFVVGQVIDLDGSTNNAGLFAKELSLVGGVPYVANFDLAGSQRGSTETATVSFGTSSESFTLASNEPLGTRSLSFVPTASGTYALSFQNLGGDNVGLLLDNVVVTAVPEPAAVVLVLAGLGVIGLARLQVRR